ncbi:glycoside hydrolase [Mucilaginibacter sp. cycad4]|uniref:GH39 family glycosyl hydrolase n=1 Tax=Mucilaginibacter sp. cycad4 TaxID=3342096 RepID=UPI002AABCD8A|nr:glycoside hydrolase [Mucilaginibacter gossypii]WPV02138.1 glycoside hydrolase [Mucilaginibacter gossypii]
MERRKFIKNTLLSTSGLVLAPNIILAAEAKGFGQTTDVDAAINVAGPGKKLVHYWSKCVGAGRANEGLRASWLEQLKLGKELCGFEYCRFHGLFHDDMFVYREVNGAPKYNWQYIDDLFDRILQIGVKPFVEFGFVPKALASTTNTTFWWKGNTSPPSDYTKWGLLISNFIKHCIERYGLNEVRSWYFEIWNEPDLHGFWDGTKTQYFDLYKVSVNAIKTVDPELRVGGPATSNFVPDERFDGEVEDKSKHKTFTVNDINMLEWRGVWIKDFLDYCTREKLPVDFISTHPYPTDWAIDPETKKGGGRVRKVNATKEDLEWLKKTVASSSYPNAEIHCTEWSSSPSPRDATHDSLQAATYLIKANIDGIGIVNSLSYWTFTDIFEEGGAGDSIFHGGFGLINYQGIVKPAFHAYRMLNQLGNEILSQKEGLIVTRDTKTNRIRALLYHYPAEVTNVVGGNVEQLLNTGKEKQFNLDLSGLKPLTVFETDKLDRDNGFSYPKWKAMGSPEPPTREQTNELKRLAMATEKRPLKADHKGNLKQNYNLQPWTCILIKEV